jgi:hypothetical protein
MIIQDFEETNALRPGPANRRGVSNMKIKITADSTCDLSETLLRQWNISLIPMHILMGEESLLDGVTVRRCIHPCAERRQDAEIRCPEPRGVHGFFCALC